MMPLTEFDLLFQKYLQGSMTPQELLRWKELVQNEAYNEQLEAQLDELVNTDQSEAGVDAPVDAMYRNIKPRPVYGMVKWAAAAAILITGSLLIYRLTTTNNHNPILPTPVIAKTIDAQPGTNGAVLTLADGSTIVLDSLQNGVVAMQNNRKAVLDNGALHYEGQSTDAPLSQLNTITTAHGKQFKLRLPDGSLAWLNAGSSITYPIAFAGTERLIQVTGEVYFEVAKKANQPFKVQLANNTIIEVTGTHFNINAYADEPAITTTLTEGAVRLRTGNSLQSIKPGQQALVQTGAIKVIDHADTTQALAWKNGIFDLNNADLPLVMRQLSRWYDVRIVYEKQPPAIRFGGKMQRNLKLSQVLNGLSGMGVRFRIEEGSRLIVY